MKKNMWRSLTVLAVITVIFNLIMFAIPFYRGRVYWCTYGFTLLSFIVSATAIYIGFTDKPGAKSKFYGFPIVRISAIYTTIQLILGISLTVFGKYVPVWLVLIIYVVILGAAVLGLIAVDTVSDHMESLDNKVKENTSFMRNLQSKINQIYAHCSDYKAAEALKKLADEIKYSDPVSNETLLEVERNLSAVVDELQQSTADEDYASVIEFSQRALSLLSERNRLCKLNKN